MRVMEHLSNMLLEAAVILNISKDHKTIDEIRALFETFLAKSTWTALEFR